MADYFATPITDWSEGLIADLHRVAELGTGEGMQLILNEARRRSVILYPEPDAEDGGSAPVKHEAKHVALHAYLHHHQIFEAAADFPGTEGANRDGGVSRPGSAMSGPI